MLRMKVLRKKGFFIFRDFRETGQFPSQTTTALPPRGAQQALLSHHPSLMPRQRVKLNVMGKVAPGVRRFDKHAARSEEGHNLWGYAA